VLETPERVRELRVKQQGFHRFVLPRGQGTIDLAGGATSAAVNLSIFTV
jgi:hypothetical protein